ncbi:hypothetical protein LCD36_04665 [Saccharopolyspora sp. 6T]|nr:hypothetical protein [Saccharopolyspora sp. 6T]MCA1185745.1 hypothetical protein [Saccharopolyspora sp. 6T]
MTAPEVPDHGDAWDSFVDGLGLGTEQAQDAINQRGKQLNNQRDEGTK